MILFYAHRIYHIIIIIVVRLQRTFFSSVFSRLDHLFYFQTFRLY